MTPNEFKDWKQENATNSETYYCNNITYELATMKDGWIAIFERDDYNGDYYPQIQARDMEHAHSWCYRTERSNVPYQVIA